MLAPTTSKQKSGIKPAQCTSHHHKRVKQYTEPTHRDGRTSLGDSFQRPRSAAIKTKASFLPGKYVHLNAILLMKEPTGNLFICDGTLHSVSFTKNKTSVATPSLNNLDTEKKAVWSEQPTPSDYSSMYRRRMRNRCRRMVRESKAQRCLLTRETEHGRLEVLLVSAEVNEGHAPVAVVHHLRPTLEVRPRCRHNLHIHSKSSARIIIVTILPKRRHRDCRVHMSHIDR